jgi:hypothetical protein
LPFVYANQMRVGRHSSTSTRPSDGQVVVAATREVTRTGAYGWESSGNSSAHPERAFISCMGQDNIETQGEGAREQLGAGTTIVV